MKNEKNDKYVLENERYQMSFDTHGGEMQSFLDKETSIQYLYQGDTPYWGGKNPGLFPIIGNTYDGAYEIDGKSYAMKNHGLIRYANLKVIKQTKNSITMELCDNEETRKQYPFSFSYQVSYTLVDNKVTITYDITNTGEKEMPFTFGLHPAFLCPLTEEEVFEDYHLIFSNPENLTQIHFDPAKKTKETYEALAQQQDFPLSYKWILDEATIVYKGMKSAYVELKGKQHGVRVSIAGYPYLAFWTPAQGAPFLCIEPWYGHADFSKVEEDFYHREGTMILSPKKTFTTSYTIEVF